MPRCPHCCYQHPGPDACCAACHAGVTAHRITAEEIRALHLRDDTTHATRGQTPAATRSVGRKGRPRGLVWTKQSVYQAAQAYVSVHPGTLLDAKTFTHEQGLPSVHTVLMHWESLPALRVALGLPAGHTRGTGRPARIPTPGAAA